MDGGVAVKGLKRDRQFEPRRFLWLFNGTISTSPTASWWNVLLHFFISALRPASLDWCGCGTAECPHEGGLTQDHQRKMLIQDPGSNFEPRGTRRQTQPLG